jgi:hypothetical protein
MASKTYFMQTGNVQRKRERNGRSLMRKKPRGQKTAEEKEGRGEKEYSPLLRRQD